MAIITFGGYIGSGKSTVAPLVAQALGYENLYVGGIFREIAKERGMSLEKFYASLASDPELERSVDARQIDLMHRSNLVVQGRMAYFFAKQSGQPAINIFLAVDSGVVTFPIMWTLLSSILFATPLISRPMRSSPFSLRKLRHGLSD